MTDTSESKLDLVFSYLAHRKVIGILGTAFPFILALGALILFGEKLQPSLSHYYHTQMGDVFVGVLFAIGFFLLSYRGYRPRDDPKGNDDLVANLAFFFALGTALFRTTPTTDGPTPGNTDFIGYVHFVFAALLFLTLIYYSLFLFTRTDQDKPEEKKRSRDKVYKVSGYVMLACILLIGLFFLFPGLAAPFAAIQPVFWLESIAVVVFGISWLTKGQAILKDET